MAYELLVIKGGREPKGYECYPEFLRSCDRHSLRPIFVPGPWRGMTAKIKNLWTYLKSGQHTGKYVLTTDCYDLVFGNPSLQRPNNLWPTMIERFKSFDTSVVFNAEKNCFPFPELIPAFDKFITEGTTSPFRYLNSGFVLGDTEAIVELLRHMRPDDIPDDRQDSTGKWVHPGDQDYYQLAFLDQPVPMKLDYQGLLCTATHGVHEEDLRSFATWDGTKPVPVLYHRDCDSNGPMAWHCNGGKIHAVVSKILRSLNL